MIMSSQEPKAGNTQPKTSLSAAAPATRSKYKWTPGPWQAVLCDAETSEKWYDIWSGEFGSVAHLSETARTDEGLRFLHGDARLIAAAPALLEACKAALAFDDDPDLATWAAMRGQLNSAIALAEERALDA